MIDGLKLGSFLEKKDILRTPFLILLLLGWLQGFLNFSFTMRGSKWLTK